MIINYIKPSYQILNVSHPNVMQFMELVGRNAYKSESKITPESANQFIKMIIDKGHDGILEHGVISIRFICSRAIANEIVRHRIASYVQLSQRYVDYSKRETINVVIPESLTDELAIKIYKRSVEFSIQQYFELIAMAIKPQVARGVLPNDFYTDIIMTINFRSLRNFLKLRCDSSAHPEMRRFVIPLLKDLYEMYPVIFKDLYDKYEK